MGGYHPPAKKMRVIDAGFEDAMSRKFGYLEN